MTWHDPLLDHLAKQPCCGYKAHGTAAAEPTALAALALAGHGRHGAARRAAGWLAELQNDDGSVGVRRGEPTPCWPTSLALLAWMAARETKLAESRTADFTDPIKLGVAWLLGTESKRVPEAKATAHDPTLVAWPWVVGTHAWIEPTALSVLALKAAGYAGHRRTIEAVELLLDRQLPRGGCNYGNTWVLGRQLRPHLQPTGLALLALSETDALDPRFERSLAYLSGNLSAETPTASLCWAILGLSAHGRKPEQSGSWLREASQRTLRCDRSPHKLALLLLAALGERSSLIALARGDPQRDLLRAQADPLANRQGA